MQEKLNIILDGKNLQGNEGETILQLARRHGFQIPTLCHDPRLKPFSSCFVCVVEVEGMKGMQPSCSTVIKEGMKIQTDNENVRSSRKMALDLLVSNHFADCVAPCTETCPAGVDVQGYISLIEKGLYHDAIGLIKQTNPLPAICGRVCVRPCELACRRNFLDEGTGVGIDYLKRFAADQDLVDGHYRPQVAPSTGKQVAIVGGGPGGLSSAYFLQQRGHQCDIYEASPQAGGWLRYGIPEYRLPNDLLDKEIATITELGVQIHCNQKLGDNLSYGQLKDQYDAVILTIGSQRGTLLRAEGEDAENVFSGIDFLRNMQMTGQKYDFSGKTVGVVGGGNTAMDCCRTAMRCGADKVYVIYRRAEEQMPASPIEVEESKLEGIEYMFLTNPVRVNQDKNGKLRSMTLIKMELGEPDQSGRRRPVPIEGSEFDMEFDYVLAAIGQKTDVNFLDDINQHADKGQLKLNRWGDVDADEQTLQTGIEHVFAAGDGVTGPATIIEAVAQAQTASRSCHQYLSGQPLQAEEQEFFSRKENFRELTSDDFAERYKQQMREEMPTLPPDKRENFKEVELGYKDAQVADHETGRCLECGCSELYTCDLKRFATEYKAEQKRFGGDFHEYEVDHSHPFIEIDNNKCILCGRCVRICREVTGANALGFINRGFETYVAPSMGESLTHTHCESCGLCVSACPTGALTENLPFKPAPVEWERAPTICNFCSVGCEINHHHKSGFILRTTGREGLINQDANICKYPRFGYHYMNHADRITQPLLKVDGQFEEISFEKAYEVIHDEIKHVEPEENAFYAGARLSNEELYLIQKLARVGAKTNNIHSFQYLTSFKGSDLNYKANVPFEDIPKAGKIYLIGSEINQENAVVGFMVNNARFTRNIPVELITNQPDSSMKHKVDGMRKISSYYHFIKALSHYLLSQNKQNDLFIKDKCIDFEQYKNQLLDEDFDVLVEKSGVSSKEDLIAFADAYNQQQHAVLIFSERNISPQAAAELFNLAMLTGKIGKTASGIISLKEKNNSQGIFDMGIGAYTGVGNQSLKDEGFRSVLQDVWQVDEIPQVPNNRHIDKLDNGKIKKLYVFGEDPMGCAYDKERVDKWFVDAEFVMVQDYFMTETAKNADLILPATMPVETSGTFTNTQRYIQQFDKQLEGRLEKENYQQLLDLLHNFDSNRLETTGQVRKEAISLLPQNKRFEYRFEYTSGEADDYRLFKHGCDAVVKYFDDRFEQAFDRING
ncbi:MAG: molybdopterin-dependent oxidoreductase [Bacteroidales bacterium]|nr:molybdopterin-dependent oxidoreductase [Bacteroidales bacterium]